MLKEKLQIVKMATEEEKEEENSNQRRAGGGGEVVVFKQGISFWENTALVDAEISWCEENHSVSSIIQLSLSQTVAVLTICIWIVTVILSYSIIFNGFRPKYLCQVQPFHIKTLKPTVWARLSLNICHVIACLLWPEPIWMGS